MPVSESDFVRKWGQLVARAWTDPEFERRLLSDPADVLAEHDIEVPEGVRCQVIAEDEEVEPDPGVFYLPFAAKPADKELSEADLAGIAGGAAMASAAGLPAITNAFLEARLKSLNLGGLFAAAGIGT